MSRHYRRLSLGQGASLCAFGVLAGLAFLIATPRVKNLPAQFLLLLGVWVFLWFFSHDLTHQLVGGIAGVKFRYYFLGRSAITKLKLPVISTLAKSIPILGLKLDKQSLEALSKNRVRLMYSSGTIASMLFPFIVLPEAYMIKTLLGVFFTLLTLTNLLFTIYFSSRAGDLRRAFTFRDIVVSRSEPQYRKGS